MAKKFVLSAALILVLALALVACADTAGDNQPGNDTFDDGGLEPLPGETLPGDDMEPLPGDEGLEPLPGEEVP